MPFPAFDRSQLILKPLAERKHDIDLSVMLPLDAPCGFHHDAIPEITRAMRKARERGAQIIVSMGAHVIRSGTGRMLIDLMEKGLITHIAMNGAGPIHDFELAMIGETTESVERYISEGQFGLWKDTGRINDAVAAGVKQGMGMGEAIGRMVLDEKFPHRDISVMAAGVRLGIPVTVHIGVGYDIIHEHPNCDGAAMGAASYQDFLIMTQSVCGLEGGVFLNFGSAVMGPEVYLKALSMARNVAKQKGEEICHFLTAAFDLYPISGSYHEEAPKTDPRYYYRPWKTILVRTVKDGGVSHYIQGAHRETVPAIYRSLMDSVEAK
ncbi:MAG: hypothetical protein P9L94_05310 [Candidatus Hinthialibacter antarcticus]|nr:hypothetical protein [Candidatus Hinthialibacter antarcticus]